MLMGLLLFVVSSSVSVLISGNFKAGKFDKSLYVGKGESKLMMTYKNVCVEMDVIRK